MSADQWAACPKCGRGDDTKNTDPNRVGQGHGGTPLREDFDIGIFEGAFDVSYKGACRSCGFTFEFNHTEKPLHGKTI